MVVEQTKDPLVRRNEIKRAHCVHLIDKNAGGRRKGGLRRGVEGESWIKHALEQAAFVIIFLHNFIINFDASLGY